MSSRLPIGVPTTKRVPMGLIMAAQGVQRPGGAGVRPWGGIPALPVEALARLLQPPAAAMNGLTERFWTSGVGRFWAKFMADFSSYGAVLIAWQSLFSLFPLIVGFLAIFSLVLQDPSQRRALADNVAQQFPSQVTDL